MSKRLTCEERLKELRKDLGIDKDAYKKKHSKYSTLPILDLSMSKKEKKEEKKKSKRIKYELADWYLNQYLKKSERGRLYRTYLDFDELVEYAYEQTLALRNIMQPNQHEVDPSTLLSGIPDDEMDIPSSQWKNYSKYCDEKFITRLGDIQRRRMRFKKKRHSIQKKFYKKGLMMYDPLFKNCQLNEKRMIENLERISEENEKRCQEFQSMMEKLIGNQAKGSEAMMRFNDHTKAMQKQVRRHIKDLEQFQVDLPFYIE